MRGFTATIKIGINAESKQEAIEEAEKYIESLSKHIPIWLEDVE